MAQESRVILELKTLEQTFLGFCDEQDALTIPLGVVVSGIHWHNCIGCD